MIRTYCLMHTLSCLMKCTVFCKMINIYPYYIIYIFFSFPLPWNFFFSYITLTFKIPPPYTCIMYMFHLPIREGVQKKRRGGGSTPCPQLNRWVFFLKEKKMQIVLIFFLSKSYILDNSESIDLKSLFPQKNVFCCTGPGRGDKQLRIWP